MYETAVEFVHRWVSGWTELLLESHVHCGSCSSTGGSAARHHIHQLLATASLACNFSRIEAPN
jgi:hypothetical protein